MNVKSIERKGNEATIVVEIDKELMESGVNKFTSENKKVSSCQKTERHANNQKTIGAPRQVLSLSTPAVFGNSDIVPRCAAFVKH